MKFVEEFRFYTKLFVSGVSIVLNSLFPDLYCRLDFGEKFVDDVMNRKGRALNWLSGVRGDFILFSLSV